jgi:hypothetical protein
LLRAENIHILPDWRMTTEGAAAYLGLSIKTLAMRRCAGTGPKFVKRGRIFYYCEDLDEWLRAGRATSTAELQKPKTLAVRS